MRKASPSYNLEVLHPLVAKEWHPTRNGELTAKDVCPGSDIKAWWKCRRKGHEWQAPVGSRTRGIGCPGCSNRLVSSDNCLSTTHPELAKEWHPTRNEGTTPDKVVSGSHLKAWWRCTLGHEWQAVIGSRATGVGCPKCSPKSSYMELRIYSELKYLFKDVLLREKILGVECDIYVPALQLAIEYDGAYWHKTRQTKDANKNRALTAGNVSLLRVRERGLGRISKYDVMIPRIANDFDILKQILISIRQLKKLETVTDKRIKHYIADGEIKNEKEFLQLHSLLATALPGTSINELNTILAKEWHPTKNGDLSPKHFTLWSNKKVWWRCSKEHEWQAIIGNRAKGKTCPYCSNILVSPENNLLSVHPKLAKEWNYTRNGSLKPSDVLPKTSKMAWWRCAKGDEWQARIYSRTNGRGCPYCANKAVNSRNCLLTVNPRLAKEWHPTKNGKLTPKHVTPGSDKKVWWVCAKGHEWVARVYERSKGKGCCYCSNRAVTPENCLLAIHPKLAKEWHPVKNGTLTPQNVVSGSHKKAWWRCAKNHEWIAEIKSRSNGANCPHCYRNYASRLSHINTK